jgi:peptidyl-prolyl cis-trans isomerase B (cyclophilin B)
MLFQNKPKPKPTPKPPPKIVRPVVTIATAKGQIQIELFPEEAPRAVDNFILLIQRGFYNGLTFHRVEPGFVLQGGDPNGDGTGGPGYVIPNETNTALKHLKSFVGMANAGRNTAGSQFYILLGNAPSLDNGNYTLFAQVISGLDVAEKLVKGDVMNRITVTLPPKYKIRFRPTGATTRAEPSFLVTPELPMSRGRYASRVLVEVTISERGNASVRLLKTSGDVGVDNALLTAIRLWKWTPAIKEGVPVRSVQQFTYDLARNARFYH